MLHTEIVAHLVGYCGRDEAHNSTVVHADTAWKLESAYRAF